MFFYYAEFVNKMSITKFELKKKNKIVCLRRFHSTIYCIGQHFQNFTHGLKQLKLKSTAINKVARVSTDELNM